MTQLAVAAPDETLRELLQKHGMNQRDLCRLWGLSPAYISDLCGGRRSITARVALRLEATFATPTAEEWMDLQRDRELRPLRRGMEAELERIREATAVRAVEVVGA